MPKWNLLCCSSWLLPLAILMSALASEKCLPLSSPHPPTRYFFLRQQQDPLWAFSSPAWRSPVPSQGRSSSPLLNLLQFMISCKDVVIILQIWSHKCWVEGNDNPFQSAEEAAGLFCCKGTLLARVVVHQDPQVLFCKATFQPVLTPPALLCRGVVPQVQF